MLEVVRQYAEAQLRDAGELPACVERHRAWYAREAARHDPDRGVPVVLEPPPWFDVEMDNLRAAFASAIDEQPCLALQLAASTWRAQLSRGQLAEALGWLTGALQRCPEVSPLRTRALFAKAVLHLRRADPEPMVGLAHAITEASQSLGDDAMAIALDQESIFTLMAHDWPSAKRRSMAALAQPGSAPAVAVGTRHFAAVLALALGEVDDARALLHEAGAALDRVPEASSPFFTTLTVSWVVDDRGPVPLPVAEDTMLLGRLVGAAQARGHLAVAAALTERLGGRTELALALLDDAIARFTADGRHLRHRLRARPAGTHAPVGRRPGGSARLLRRRRAGPPILARSALHRHGTRRAVLRRRPAGGADHRPSARPGSGVDDGTERRHRRRRPHPRASKGSSSWSWASSTPPCHRWSGACSWPTGGVTPVYAIGWEYLLVAHLRHAVGDADASARAAAEAAARFQALGDRRGQRALQRARKAGVVTMPS